MSTLQVTNITTANGTTDLVIKTGNTTGPQIVIAANGQSITLRGNSVSNSVFINTSSVFINGSIPSSNILSLTATGSVVISGNVTPTIITSNTSAWNPGTSNVYVIRLQANAAGTASNTAIYEAYISGLTAGTNGQVLILSNIGSQKIQLRNEDSANETTAGNRFSLPNHVWLGGYQSLKIIYDGTLARWRPMNSLLISMDHKYALTKGFFAGGETPTLVATTDKITYATEANSAVAGANLSQARYGIGAAGNSDKGFFIGGFVSPAYVTTADRTRYSTETTAAVSGANLSQGRYSPAATGNADKGFFSGGGAPAGSVTTTDRTTYATETTAAVSGANLSQARRGIGGSGNSDKGFFIGGLVSPTIVATADRTRYSTETTAAVSGANLSQARSFNTATGNSDKGFFSGGETPTLVATADRTTYSSETTAAVSGANLSQARAGVGGAGNDDKGFFAGGYTSITSPYSPVVTAGRTTYSTESHAAVTGANLSQARDTLAGV